MTYLASIFEKKKVLITGHTGFKGSWLSVWLNNLGAEVVGISDVVPTVPSNFVASGVQEFVTNYFFDITNLDNVLEVFAEHEPDFVFHLAAQALVYPAYSQPAKTLLINSIGTVNVLEAIRKSKRPLVAIMITSDKVYENVEWVWGYRETDKIGGKDPYSASKGMAELAIKTYVESFFNSPETEHKIAIARAGNVIGGGDWADFRLVPDGMKAWHKKEVVNIRNPNSTRPWQHVLEPLSGYLLLAADLYLKPYNHGEAFNFGPQAQENYTVRELIEKMAAHWSNIRWNSDTNQNSLLPEANLLKLNCDKALINLSWLPTMNFGETVELTVEWYKGFYSETSTDMGELTRAQIAKYTALGRSRKRIWAC